MKFLVNSQIDTHYAYCFFPFPFNNGACNSVCTLNCSVVCSSHCGRVTGPPCANFGNNDNNRETQNGGLFGQCGVFGDT